MDPISLLGVVVSHLPIVDLVTKGMDATSGGGFIYDVAQAMIGVKLIATGADKVAQMTPWKWDDGPARGALGFVTKTTAWITGLASTPKKKK